ncbi:MAG: response regulator, partial [Deltaproteobacteria bacterium]|nr:response regulator [Deltaproteobacteria bacterium]
NLVVRTESKFAFTPGKYVTISVQDEGIGIPGDHLAKIFDPYFTTKPKGSGLGLATVYSIIKNHHGHIAVESNLGAGSTFTVFLPARDQKVAPQPQAEGELVSGKGKILVMDDEPMVRRVVEKMLLTLGYEAEFAEDGTKALELYTEAQARGEPFALVILDLTVPGGMGGKEAIAELLQIDPQVRAIVSSGYSDDPIMAHFEQYGFIDVIAKPYGIPDIDKVLKRTLGRSQLCST